MRSTRKLLERKLVKDRRLGELLMEEGLITEQQFHAAIEDQAGSGGVLAEILVNCGFISERDLVKCLVDRLQLPYIQTELYDISRETVTLLPHALLHQHRIIPLDTFGKTLTIASTGSLSHEVVEEIETTTSLDVMVYIASVSDIQLTLRTKFPLEKMADALSDRLDELFKDDG